MATATVGDHRHHVHFYEDPSALARRLGEFFRDALVRGGSAIAIARPELHAAIEHELHGHCLDVGELLDTGRLIFADAQQELASFMTDAGPDREKFRTRATALVDRARAAATNELVHAYGEMVDVLWTEHRTDSVVALEQLWCDLVAELDLVLACGYKLGTTASEADVTAICSLHDSVAIVGEPGNTSHVTSMIASLDRRARTLETEVARRQRLETRMLRLLAVTTELAGARTRDEIARVVIESGGAAVGAVSASLWIVNGNELHLHRSSYGDRTTLASYEHLDLDADLPATEVARTAKPIFIGSLADYRLRFPDSFSRMAPRLPAELALAMLPVACGTEVWGVLCFTYDHVRAFEGPDRAFKELLARQCALALERVQLHEEETATRREVELLYDLITEVNATEELERVYELTLDSVLRGSRSDRAAILLFDPDGVMRFKAARGLSEKYQRAVEGHSPWRPDSRDPAPVAVDDTEADPAWVAYRDIFRAEGIRALAFVPLVHHHKLVGKLMLYRNEPLKFSEHDIQLSSTIAVHVAQAVERKRVYTEERDAHMLADEATRAREEILSVVSHDLRNPLGTILVGASAMLNMDLGEKGQRLRTAAERIHRQAERMARMIDDLVDFAGIQAGRLSLARAPHRPEEIISAARDMLGPLANERGLAFEARIPPGLPRIECDSERALQVISNLVSNALKVTPRGGQIAIGAEPRGEQIVFFVRDTGPGIDAEDLPNLFERFWRSKTSNYKGAGLGLSIARGIVDAHGGRIWAESQIGVGSTFYFSLSGLHRN